MIIHLFRIDLRECSVTYSQEYVKEGNVEEGRVICPSELVSYLRSITLWIYLQYLPSFTRCCTIYKCDFALACDIIAAVYLYLGQ